MKNDYQIYVFFWKNQIWFFYFFTTAPISKHIYMDASLSSLCVADTGLVMLPSQYGASSMCFLVSDWAIFTSTVQGN